MWSTSPTLVDCQTVLGNHECASNETVFICNVIDEALNLSHSDPITLEREIAL